MDIYTVTYLLSGSSAIFSVGVVYGILRSNQKNTNNNVDTLRKELTLHKANVIYKDRCLVCKGEAETNKKEINERLKSIDTKITQILLRRQSSP